MNRISSPSLRALLFALLVLGTLVRPLLVLGCEIHAAKFAHAAQPHDHAHAGVAGDEEQDQQGHGEHELLHQGALGGAVDTVQPFVLVSIAPASDPVSRPVAPSLPERQALAPFRPPIA